LIGMTTRFGLVLLLVLMIAAPPAICADNKDDPKKRDPRNAKEDVEAIGDRDVGKGLNFYSLEKEIALGKALAQDIERHAKIVDDPIVSEYVNRVGQNLVRN
jgi:predicted Zn-dependent protease